MIFEKFLMEIIEAFDTVEVSMKSFLFDGKLRMAVDIQVRVCVEGSLHCVTQKLTVSFEIGDTTNWEVFLPAVLSGIRKEMAAIKTRVSCRGCWWLHDGEECGTHGEVNLLGKHYCDLHVPYREGQADHVLNLFIDSDARETESEIVDHPAVLTYSRGEMSPVLRQKGYSFLAYSKEHGEFWLGGRWGGHHKFPKLKCRHTYEAAMAVTRGQASNNWLVFYKVRDEDLEILNEVFEARSKKEEEMRRV